MLQTSQWKTSRLVYKTHLQFLDDDHVVVAGCELPARSRTSELPVLDSALHHVAVDFKRQGVDLAVQVDGDGYGASLS